MVLAALPDVREDAERRARGVTIEDWVSAPSFAELGYVTRADCEDGIRPCPALRCKRHLGRYGEAHGYSCEADVAELPENELAAREEPGARQTFDLIGRLLNISYQRAQQARDSGMSRVRELDPEVLRALGVRRRRA